MAPAVSLHGRVLSYRSGPAGKTAGQQASAAGSDMTQMVSERLEELRAAMAGPVIAPGDPGYDNARRVWNAGIDRHPAAIARCDSTADVVAALAFARGQGLEVSVRGGAHNTAGTAVCDDGLMIDLSKLNDVTVDPGPQRAQVGGGALLADLDAASMDHGLAVPAGMISHTGVGGLTLGGGMGWLTREFGLSIDNLLSAEIVTASGQVVRTAADERPELFWAIRGGGGNFGIATRFEFQLHEVSPTVQLGMFFWGLDQGREALQLARDVAAEMPPGINAVIAALNAPAAPFVPPEHHLAPGFALILTGFGSPRHQQLVEEIRDRLPPRFDLVTPMPYVGLQQLLDDANAWGSHCYEKGTYLEYLSDDVIEVLTTHVAAKTSPRSLVLLYRLDGAYSQVGDDETAFSGGRSPRFGAFIVGVAPDADGLSAERAWVGRFWNALRPHAAGSGDGYVNGTSDYRDAQVRGSYGAAKYERLARVKAEYDPANLFHGNANITPAGAIAGTALPRQERR
jgi:FAD/FMN-containing dehydrogenase